MATNVEPLPFEPGDMLPPLTEWENEPTVRDLKKDYTEARSNHDAHIGQIQRWLDNLNVEGSAKIEKRKGRSTIVPKLIRKQAEWRYAALSEPFLSQEDVFKAEPRTWKDKQAAYENVLVLNYQFNNQIDKVTFIDEYVRTAVDEGTVVVRVGWEFAEEEQEVEVPVTEIRPISDPQLLQEKLANGEPPIEEVQVGVRTELQMITVENKPTVEICDYNDVIIDPTCNGNLNKANFVIYRFETSMAELEKAGKYQNLDNIDIESNSILSEPDDLEGNVQSFNFQDKPRKKIVAYEYWGYWDIHDDGKLQPFVATWIGDTMIRMEEAPFPDKKLPFVLVQYLPKRNQIYGEPDGELLEDNQKVLGAVTRGMIDIMGRSAAGQKGTRVDALDVTNRRKFEAGEDYEFQAHVDPRQAFFDHAYPDIPQSAQFMIEMQQLEAESLTGVKAFHQGISGDAFGSVATAARGAMDASGKREVGILRRLAEGVKKIGYKIIAMNGEFLSDEEIIPITDEEFVSINRENLVGRFDLELDISSAEMDNIKAQELAFMLQTMGNTMPPEMSQIILADIARLRKMPELAKNIREYQPQPDPIDEQMKMLELQKLQAEVMKLQSEAGENKANAMLDVAKAQTEQMKSRHLGAQADMLDLNFLEEEKGINHVRDLQKQGAQANANAAMKEREADRKDQNTLLQALTRNNTPRAPSAQR
jgi:hypothetical protein